MMPQFSFYLLKALSRLRKYSFPIIAAWILLLHRHDSPFGEKWNERKHNDSDIWSSADDRIRFILNKEDKDRIAEFIRVRHPRWAKSSIKRADNILSHVITILGKDFNVGKDVEWHKDFQSGYTWPLNDYRRFREQLTPKGTDVKIPWELSRFHQGLLLGKAYAITKDEIYAEEFAAEFCD
jgi:hypothetical protein